MIELSTIKKGDIVSIKNDVDNIIFYISDIVKKEGNQIVYLKGVTLRIETCTNIENIKIVEPYIIEKNVQRFEENINNLTDKIIEINDKKIRKNRSDLKRCGKILHLDGDKKYAIQSSKVYSKFGLNAIVKNIKESRQPAEIRPLLDKYNPDIIILTGHDGMIKKGTSFNNINNYRNSKYFVKTVIEARKWEQGINKLSIFAGACQSYYEAIMEAGANFASSPARILIDFMDPIVIARKVAITPDGKYITIKEIRDEIRNGERGISGIGSFGKLTQKHL